MEEIEQLENIDNQYALIAYLTQQAINNKPANQSQKNNDKENERVKKKLAENNKKISALESQLEEISEKLGNLDRQPEPETKEQESSDETEEKVERVCSISGCTARYESKAGMASHLSHRHGKRGSNIVRKYSVPVVDDDGKDSDNVADVEDDSEDVSTSHDVDAADVTVFECSTCGNEYESSASYAGHVNNSNGHTSISDEFKEDGVYKCPICGEKFEEAQPLSNHANDAHDATVSAFHVLKNRGKFSDSESERMYDEHGNLIQLEKVRNNSPEHFSDNQLIQMTSNYLDEKHSALTAKEVLRGLFDREFSTDTWEYKKFFKLLKESDSIEATQMFGREYKFYTEAAQLESSRMDEAIQDAKDKIGEHDYKHFVRAVKNFIPEEGEENIVTYYDFSGEYISGPKSKYDTEKVWELFVSPAYGELRNALKALVDEDMQFSPQRRNDAQSVDSLKDWELRIIR